MPVGIEDEVDVDQRVGVETGGSVKSVAELAMTKKKMVMLKRW